MIFIAKHYNGVPMSIISCKTKEQAMSYWQGKGLEYNKIEEFDALASRENEEMGFVTPLLTTEQRHPSALNRDSQYKITMVV